MDDLQDIHICYQKIFKKNKPQNLFLWVRLGVRERSHRGKESNEATIMIRMILI
jgi:hypothetical protein